MTKEEAFRVTYSNADLLQRIYDAAARGDLQPLLDTLKDDIAWQDSSLGPLAGDYRGKEEVLTFFGRMADVYAGTLRLEVLDIVANDNHGVVLTSEQGESAGELIMWRGTHIFTFRDGRCAEFLAMNDAAYNRFWATRASSSKS
jgi:ketosteroid isomerase-like protein